MSSPIRSGPLPEIEHSAEVALTPSQSRALTAGGASAGSVKDMITFAMEKNVPVESLEKLFGLYERMTAREAAQEFNEALAKFRLECPPIKKAKTANVAMRSGGSYSFTYADLPEIQTTVDPPLANNGFSYSWDSEADAKGMMKVTCTLRHVNGHSTSSSMALPTENASAMSPQQKYGAAMRFAQRRTLEIVLGLKIEDEHPDTPRSDPTPIDDDQALYLADLVKESGTNLQKLLKHFEITSLEQLPAVNYNEAVSVCKERQQRKAGRQ
jgi:hypothetical protein